MADPLHAVTPSWSTWTPPVGAIRPAAVVVCSNAYLASVPDLVIVDPVTTRERGWPHHVRLGGDHLGLERASFVMTEQPRTISRARNGRRAGAVGQAQMAQIDRWLRDFTDL